MPCENCKLEHFGTHLLNGNVQPGNLAATIISEVGQFGVDDLHVVAFPRMMLFCAAS